MSDTSDKNIRAHREVIWHLTCGHCHYYWTYPTMNMNEDITKKSFHCPLCGVKSHASIASDLPNV